MKLQFIVYLVAITMARGATSSGDHVNNNQANDLVDFILERVRPAIRQRHLDPIDLPQLPILELVEFTGELKGLSEIYRKEEAQLIENGETQDILFKTSARDIVASANITFMRPLAFIAQVSGRIDEVIGWNRAQGPVGGPWQINDLVLEGGEATVIISGLPPILDFLLEELSGAIAQVLETKVLDLMTGEVRDVFNDVMADIRSTTAQPTTTTTHIPSTTNKVTTRSTTTVKLTTENPTTHKPTTIYPTTHKPTTVNPTTHKPTTIYPTTHKLTTHKPTTHKLTTVNLTTNKPTTIYPTTHKPTPVNHTTTANPTTTKNHVTTGKLTIGTPSNHPNTTTTRH